MTITFRLAEPTDLPTLIDLLADDSLGQSREDNSRPVADCYQQAFQHILTDDNNEILLLITDNNIAGMAQLTYIPSLSRMGSWRCQIESVRIDSKWRGKGLGEQLFKQSFKRAANRHCQLVQLTSDKLRDKAIHFYESLGFVASHEGLKKTL